MRKKLLKFLYQDIKDLNLPEVEYVRVKEKNKDGRTIDSTIILSRNCKRFYKKMAKYMWKNSRTVLHIDPQVLQMNKQLQVQKPTPEQV